jgi:hypothetical protein
MGKPPGIFNRLCSLPAPGQLQLHICHGRTSTEDRMVAAQWARHNALLGAKQQVIAQYGDDSDEAQAVGLTKKSERAKPAARAKAAATPAK